MMKKTVRLATMFAIILTIVLMSLAGTVWASPTQQGTVPSAVTTQVGSGGGTLNTGTGLANVPSGAIPPGGNATAQEQNQTQLNNLGAPPPGQNFQGNGLNLQIQNSSGNPVTFFGAPVLVCFPTPPGALVVIRRWFTAAELQAVGRITTVGAWIAFPSFVIGGQTCTRVRLPGSYAPVG